MRTALRSTLLTAVALGGLAVAGAASAQSYGGGYGAAYAPNYSAGFGAPYVSGVYTPNSDGMLGYGNYVSRLDTTPDDPGRYGYDAERDRRVAAAQYQSQYQAQYESGGYGRYGDGAYRDRYQQPPTRYGRVDPDCETGAGYRPTPPIRYGYGVPRY